MAGPTRQIIGTSNSKQRNRRLLLEHCSLLHQVYGNAAEVGRRESTTSRSRSSLAENQEINKPLAAKFTKKCSRRSKIETLNEEKLGGLLPSLQQDKRRDSYCQLKEALVPRTLQTYVTHSIPPHISVRNKMPKRMS